MPRTLLILLIAALCGPLRAHTVPQIIIEAEFNSRREAMIKVNLDPRLFLSPDPTTLPPVPASWWFDQDEASKAKTSRAAAEYVARTFTFKVGAASLKADWKVQPIDSASAFPLGQASTEAHLLAEHKGTLPESAGDFKVAVAKDCAVIVILLTSNTGDAERRPEPLFGGETSRPFPLAALSSTVPATAASEASGGGISQWFARLGWFLTHTHFIWDHLALAALLGIALHRSWWRAIALLAGFHAADLLAACLVMTGWLPSAPLWMTAACWIALALAAVHLFVLKSRDSTVLATLAVAGLCHGLDAPHLHLDAAAAWMPLLFTQTGVLLFFELAVLSVCGALIRFMRPVAPQPCANAA